MQNNRQVRENSRTGGRQFDSFGRFGFHDSMFSSIFGGRDPFDDPFFTHPHGSFFSSDNSPRKVEPATRSKGPVIEELDSDDEGALENEENDANNASWANRNPLVEHPEDQGDGHGRNDKNRGNISSIVNHNKVEPKKPVTGSVSFQKVTYGGINGAYYTATTSRRTGDDGVTLEESKQADRTTGQAAHKVSRGIHDKGHSVMRKLGPDGKVDTTQSLHNLNEDELEGFERSWGGIASGFERSWGGIASSRFPGWNDFQTMTGSGSSRVGPLAAWGGFSDPFGELSQANRSRSFNQKQSSGGRPKKVVTINIE